MLEAHYRAHRDRLVRRLSYLGRENAEDIVQDAYVKALSVDMDGVEMFEPWFDRILSQCIGAYFKRDVETAELDDYDRPSPCSAFHHLQLQEVVKEIEKRPERQRLILHMALVRQLPYYGISNRTGESENNIRQLVYRFRLELAQKGLG